MQTERKRKNSLKNQTQFINAIKNKYQFKKINQITTTFDQQKQIFKSQHEKQKKFIKQPLIKQKQFNSQNISKYYFEQNILTERINRKEQILKQKRLNDKSPLITKNNHLNQNNNFETDQKKYRSIMIKQKITDKEQQNIEYSWERNCQNSPIKKFNEFQQIKQQRQLKLTQLRDKKLMPQIDILLLSIRKTLNDAQNLNK